MVKDMETVDDNGRAVVQPQVIIVDEFTGRLMPGRRWSDGLHEAVEAKEGIRIARENQTLATITLQNYFRMYDKLAGMTGTAATEAEEFAKIYKLDVTVIPTNRPLGRLNHPDVVYKTEREKFDAVTNEIAECHAKGQPVLVGTVSIEKSERLSKLLKRRGIPHQVLNAKYHEREAEIVAQAGREKTVTIATNMAGRGTDILLGGNPDFLAKAILSKKGFDPATAPAAAREAALGEGRKATEPEHERVVGLGGLHIIGTERHESRRIDNQLRGRSGRQGDPGSSRFYLSLEDDLLRIFGSERIQRIMDRLGMEEGEPIEHKLVTRAISTAQKRVETRNFEIRKHLLEYDDVMNKQREIVYGLRRQCLEDESQEATVLEWVAELADDIVERYAPADAHPEDWDLKGLNEALYRQFDFRLPADANAEELTSREALLELVRDSAERNYRDREAMLGAELFHRLERWIMLGLEWQGGGFRGINQLWREHLLNMDHLKEGIGLRGYGQRDPLVEYKKEAFDMFQEMIDHLREVVVEQLFRVRATREEPLPQPVAAPVRAPWQESRGGEAGGASATRVEPRVADGAEGGTQRSLPMRVGQEVQEVLSPEGRLAPVYGCADRACPPLDRSFRPTAAGPRAAPPATGSRPCRLGISQPPSASASSRRRDSLPCQSARRSRGPGPRVGQHLVPREHQRRYRWGFFLGRSEGAMVSIASGSEGPPTMRLQGIFIHGFKSFADKTPLEIFPGVTCVVGPNGCGKSNVADAVRWALGEQSPKLLRGQKMEDVIFHGTTSRRSIGMAEVSLLFHNDGRLDGALERSRGGAPPLPDGRERVSAERQRLPAAGYPGSLRWHRGQPQGIRSHGPGAAEPRADRQAVGASRVHRGGGWHRALQAAARGDPGQARSYAPEPTACARRDGGGAAPALVDRAAGAAGPAVQGASPGAPGPRSRVARRRFRRARRTPPDAHRGDAEPSTGRRAVARADGAPGGASRRSSPRPSRTRSSASRISGKRCRRSRARRSVCSSDASRWGCRSRIWRTSRCGSARRSTHSASGGASLGVEREDKRAVARRGASGGTPMARRVFRS